MEYRTEHDSMGEVQVPAWALWGAQTERSRRNFPIGVGLEPMPSEIIRAFAQIKKASLSAHFPLVVWQTGSGTQSNMNVNEVIANRGNGRAGKALLHPNDDVNLSQSSNDTFPTALRVAAVRSVEGGLLPAVDGLIAALRRLEAENEDVLKIGRTHLQDATPLRFSQEISGWRGSLEQDRRMLLASLPPLREIALGGTAVGTGLNAPKGFDLLAAETLSIKALASDLMKIANDVRLLASGPRCGLGEITIPANEPGSSIMPGKVNPTQCEQVTMAAVQVLGNDAAIAIAASQGNFELNVFLPVCAYNFLQSSRLLAESVVSFTERCVRGIRANRERMAQNVERSLMLATALSPYVGYEKAARIAQIAAERGISLREACVESGLLSAERFDEIVRPERMV